MAVGETLGVGANVLKEAGNASKALIKMAALLERIGNALYPVSAVVGVSAARQGTFKTFSYSFACDF